MISLENSITNNKIDIKDIKDKLAKMEILLHVIDERNPSYYIWGG